MCLSKATGDFGRLSVVNPISGELLKWQRCTAKREIVVGECSFTEYFRSNDSSIGNWGKKVPYSVLSTPRKSINVSEYYNLFHTKNYIQLSFRNTNY